jgi:DNA-binding NarL/FixJ family response regulator
LTNPSVAPSWNSVLAANDAPLDIGYLQFLEAVMRFSTALAKESLDVTNDPLNAEVEDPARIKILSVDDHPLLREGIATVINSEPDMLLVATAANGTDGIEAFRALRPNVTLMDLRLPDLNGIEAMIAIRTEFPDARIIVLTASEGDVEIQRALQAGARAYLLKSMPTRQIVDTIRQVHAGKKCFLPEIAVGLAEHLTDEALSEREMEVLHEVVQGNRNQDIAKRLFISRETVKVHLKHIMGKLAATDRTHAVTIAIRRGIIQL